MPWTRHRSEWLLALSRAALCRTDLGAHVQQSRSGSEMIGQLPHSTVSGYLLCILLLMSLLYQHSALLQARR